MITDAQQQPLPTTPSKGTDTAGCFAVKGHFRAKPFISLYPMPCLYPYWAWQAEAAAGLVWAGKEKSEFVGLDRGLA